MKTVSVITAVRAGGSGYLDECAESVLSQDLPDGFVLEWLVQEDAQQPSRIARFGELDQRVRYEVNGANQQAAGTRNLALGRAVGQYVRNVDDDDIMAAGSLRAALEVLESDVSLQYVTGPVLDLCSDGSIAEFDMELPAGRIPRRMLADLWAANSYRGVVHPTGLLVRRDILLLVGGWMALLASEDTGALLAISEIAEGYHLDVPVALYRKHGGQVSSTLWATGEHSRRARYATISARVASIRNLGVVVT